tara:strand:+ start:14371 stop:14661 length:291 start_codon:yes stop_codon:yes gene_type:complete
MKITNKLIKEIATLCKLEFNCKDEEKMKNDMNKIIHFVEKLNQIDTKEIDPLIYISDENNVLREDVVKLNSSQKEALINAPEKDSDYFKVPTILKK